MSHPAFAHSGHDRGARTLRFIALPLLFLVLPSSAVAATWSVDQAGGGDRTTITAAVSSASDGDTILIGAATYIEAVTTSKALVFIGKDPDAVFWQKDPDGWYSLTFNGAAYGEVHGIRFSAVGPALCFTNCTGPSLITNCRFESLIFPNVAGAAVYSMGQILEILDCAFIDCHTTGQDWGPGAVYLYSLVEGCRIADSSFENCTSDDYGGAVRYTGTGFTVEYCSFSECSADRGGAILSEASLGVIRGNTFHVNSAGSKGGAFYNYFYEGTRFSTNLFLGNSAGAEGGAIWGNALNPTGRIFSNLFHGNDAPIGGAIYEDLFTPEIEANTFYGNTAGVAGSAVYLKSGSPHIFRNIISTHDGTAAIECLATPTFSCNDFWDNFGGDVNGCGVPEEADGNIFLDPRFCDAPQGNFELAGDSPCASGNNPPGCDPFGYSGVGCQETPIKTMSWGAIRASFR